MTAAAKDEHFAFPHVEPTDSDGDIVVQDYGLTKRELFAGMAMQGLLADPEVGQEVVSSLAEGAGRIAILSVIMADALLAELAKGAERG